MAAKEKVAELKPTHKITELKPEPKIVVKEATPDLVVENAPETGERISLPPELVPIAVTKEQMPRQPYWVGTCKNPCFHATRIAGFEFPGSSFENPPGKGPSNHKLGTMLMLTKDEELMIVAKSVSVGWRHKFIQKKVGVGKNAKLLTVVDKWEPVHYDAGNPPIPGDTLTADYVFMRKLKPGQRIPLGLIDSDGEPLPTPQPLRVRA